MSIDVVKVGNREYRVAPIEPPQSPHPDSAYLAITPAVAARWLAFNRSNRSVRKRATARQSRDIATGNWDINGETIKLSRPLLHGEVPDIPVGGVLFMDGQHRLESCVESGVPFVTLVAWGLEPEARLTVDDGAARKMGDVLRMEGLQHNTILATVLRRQMMWNGGDRSFRGKFAPTKAEMLAFLRTDEHAFLRAVQQASHVRERFKVVGPTVVAQAYYLCSQVGPADVPWFFERVRDGANLDIDHPVLVLRERLAREKSEKKIAQPHQQLAYFIRAWNAHRKNTSLRSIVQPPDAPTPDPI